MAVIPFGSVGVEHAFSSEESVSGKALRASGRATAETVGHSALDCVVANASSVGNVESVGAGVANILGSGGTAVGVFLVLAARSLYGQIEASIAVAAAIEGFVLEASGNVQSRSAADSAKVITVRVPALNTVVPGNIALAAVTISTQPTSVGSVQAARPQSNHQRKHQNPFMHYKSVTR